jgi:hypothetical protein
VGPDAKFLPGRAFPPEEFERVLQKIPLEAIKVKRWQVDYDLAWAIKTGVPQGGGIRPLPEIMRCPACKGDLKPQGQSFYCTTCHTQYPIAEDGVIEMA